MREFKRAIRNTASDFEKSLLRYNGNTDTE